MAALLNNLSPEMLVGLACVAWVGILYLGLMGRLKKESNQPGEITEIVSLCADW